jgi:hypothetical protein
VAGAGEQAAERPGNAAGERTAAGHAATGDGWVQ